MSPEGNILLINKKLTFKTKYGTSTYTLCFNRNMNICSVKKRNFSVNVEAVILLFTEVKVKMDWPKG